MDGKDGADEAPADPNAFGMKTAVKKALQEVIADKDKSLRAVITEASTSAFASPEFQKALAGAIKEAAPDIGKAVAKESFRLQQEALDSARTRLAAGRGGNTPGVRPGKF